MDYFFSHIGYILIAALCIAALAAAWGFGSVYNAKKRDREMQEKQDKACSSCALASMCSRIGVEENCEDRVEAAPAKD